MEKWALSGSVKRKQKKEKEAKDAALVQQIPSISTFFTRKPMQDDQLDDGAQNSGARTTPQRSGDQQDANAASSSSPETFGSDEGTLPPMDTVRKQYYGGQRSQVSGSLS
ncbi:hypothetical protein GBF38_014654 [Nibea albiflora]|uniref:Uncharacterized protein n=1 Tax=Nibea albiflora TaxID=240163 RepID=A0ACB7F7C5_NIBAL|nr:hypothetical protein GBF38_014654 [Nibea albiflora]